MTAQLDLFAPDHECVVHAILPDFSTACGLDFLDATAGCENRAKHMHLSSHDWHEVTCVWCHALGRRWYAHWCRRQQDRQEAAA